MFTSYLSYLASHPYTWGTLAILFFCFGAAFAFPRLRLGRGTAPPRRLALAFYLWAGAALSVVTVFFVPLRLRMFEEASLYFHLSVFGGMVLCLLLRRLGLILVFFVFLLAGTLAFVYHQTWTPASGETEAAVVRVLSTSSGAVTLEMDIQAPGANAQWGPVEVVGELVTVEAETVRVPDSLFFLGMGEGYRFLRLVGLSESGEPQNDWLVPGAGAPVPLLDALTRRGVQTVTFKPALMERYAVILRPQAQEVLSYKQL